MPWTAKQVAMLHEDVAGKGTKGPSPAVAKKMLAEQHGHKVLPPVNARPATQHFLDFHTSS